MTLKPRLPAIRKRDPLRITEPMRIVLLNAQQNDGIIPNVYPYGQMRMIKAGLARRELIEPADEENTRWKLTEAGWRYK